MNVHLGTVFDEFVDELREEIAVGNEQADRRHYVSRREQAFASESSASCRPRHAKHFISGVWPRPEYREHRR